MNAFTAVCRTAAVALLAGLLACAGVVPAMAATPKDLKITLPTEPVLATPIAVSGKNLLVEADGAFRLSHDNGKHWVKANVPFTCGGPCSAQPRPIGDVSGGVVTANGSSLDAYSLVSNARVGTSYLVPANYSVMHLVGDLAMLYNFDTERATVRSLATGTVREIHPPSGYSLNFTNLLPDGSVLLRDSNDNAPTWIRISPAGDVTTVRAASSPTALQRVSENLLLFQATAGKATTFCLITLPGTVASCRSAVGTRPVVLAMTSAGFLIEDSRHALRWYPIAAGRITSSRSVSGVTLHTGKYTPVQSIENAYPVIAQRNASTSWLERLTSGRKAVTVPLGWARRPVSVTQLALSTHTLLGGYSGDSLSTTWRRSAISRIGAQHGVSRHATDPLIASGSRWAISDADGVRLYDNSVGKLTLTRYLFKDASLRQSGPHLLVTPRPDQSEGGGSHARPAMVLDPAGKQVGTVPDARDVFGSLVVEQSGDDATFTVRDFLDPKAEVVKALPDPGAGGYYLGVTIWGDWVAATRTSGEWWSAVAVAHNYRTGVTRTAPGNASLMALGDGFAVIEDHGSDQVRVWNVAKGTVTSLVTTGTRAADPVATDGARVAFVRSGSLVVRTVAGAGKTAPRVLGVVAPAALKGTWKAAIDLTKAVRSGRLEIRDSTGKLVRSLTVKATKDGSLRGITWNGRNKAGKRVTTGSYTYALTNRAADGTGDIRLANGSVGPIGTIQVP